MSLNFLKKNTFKVFHFWQRIFRKLNLLRGCTYYNQRQLDFSSAMPLTGAKNGLCVLCVLFIEVLAYLLTPWSGVLLEKLTGLQLVKKFPAFYGTREFITALPSACHLSLSWASSIQSRHPHPNSRRPILILSSHLRLGLPSGLFPSGFPTKTLYTTLPFPHACYMSHSSHSSWFYHPHNIGWGVQIIQLLIM